MRRRVLVILLLLTPPPLYGQSASLEPGMLLRVQARGFDLEGNLVRLEADSLVVWTGTGSTASGPADRAIAVSDIDRLELGIPRSGWRGAGRGALWGGLAGSLLGTLIGAGMETDCFLCPSSRGEAVAIGAIFVGGLGAGVGALVGAAFPGTRWESAPLPSPNPSR